MKKSVLITAFVLAILLILNAPRALASNCSGGVFDDHPALRLECLHVQGLLAGNHDVLGPYPAPEITQSPAPYPSPDDVNSQSLPTQEPTPRPVPTWPPEPTD